MPPYSDTDFLYFDTEKRSVIGPVEWTKTGTVKPLQKPGVPEEGEDRKRRGRPRKEYYIWGTYRSLKRLYNLEGKTKREESTQTLDEAMGRALQEPYWN
ncbi:MAG: hypothetical protein PHN33_02585 [Candidatus Peribacteraceae bacterium]|jgi:hypothetical protein|nr:hypothetical protein [Candidatus Peribacteraceae bacterium]